MLEGTCKKCGRESRGWALKQPEHRVCGTCGGEIAVTEVTITEENGKELRPGVAVEFLDRLQAGTLYWPQNR